VDRRKRQLARGGEMSVGRGRGWGMVDKGIRKGKEREGGDGRSMMRGMGERGEEGGREGRMREKRRDITKGIIC